jgi:hypothetical protein
MHVSGQTNGLANVSVPLQMITKFGSEMGWQGGCHFFYRIRRMAYLQCGQGGEKTERKE